MSVEAINNLAKLFEGRITYTSLGENILGFEWSGREFRMNTNTGLVEERNGNLLAVNDCTRLINRGLSVLRSPDPERLTKAVKNAFLTAETQDEQWKDEDTVRLIVKNIMHEL